MGGIEMVLCWNYQEDKTESLFDHTRDSLLIKIRDKWSIVLVVLNKNIDMKIFWFFPWSKNFYYIAIVSSFLLMVVVIV